MAKGKGKQRVVEKPSKRCQSFQPRSILHSRASLFQGTHSFFKRQFIHSPPAGAKLTWLKRIFRILVVILKNQEKDRRDLKRMASKANWITKQIEASSGAKYVPPPEMEIELTDEEEELRHHFKIS